MTETQSKSTPVTDGPESITFGLYDRLYDHGHVVANVVLVHANADGEPDWENTGPANVWPLPADKWPDDPKVARRAAVLLDHVDGCSPGSSFVIKLDGDTPELIQIAGPVSDRPIAEQIIARDIAAIPPPRSPGALAQSIASLTGEWNRGPAPANDNEQEGAAEPLTATPFTLRDPASLPERDWLFGRHYIRKYLTATVGAGGGGKSAHAVSEALAMVTGRPLLDPDGPLTKRLKVWYINAEDPRDEIDRRFHAAAKHFCVTQDQIGDRLFTDSGREYEFVIMRQDGRSFRLAEPMIEEMVAEIRRRDIDVLIVDPFVSTHEVPENDNTAIQRVAKAWLFVAESGDCCVEVIHHIVKGGAEVTADSSRGGGALKDKARSVRTLNPMSLAQAEKAGIDNPAAYFRIGFGKSNMAAAGRTDWRRFVSVPLKNGRGLVKTGDEIGVVEPWAWPDSEALAEREAEAKASAVADVPTEVLEGIKTRLANADHKASNQAKTWAGIVVAEILGVDLSDKAERQRVTDMLAAWVELGDLQIVDLPDHRRHLSPHVKPALRDPENEGAQE